MDKRIEAAKMSQELIKNCLESPELRIKETAFTRRGRLGAKQILYILLHRLAASLQVAIDKYFDFIGEAPVSKQAFSKARSGLNPEYVRKFADGIALIHAQDTNAPSYQGRRLVAIDGTDIALENSPE